VGLLGPNGAGKSTLFNILSTYHIQDSGHILALGKEITTYSDFYKSTGLCA